MCTDVLLCCVSCIPFAWFIISSWTERDAGSAARLRLAAVHRFRAGKRASRRYEAGPARRANEAQHVRERRATAALPRSVPPSPAENADSLRALCGAAGPLQRDATLSLCASESTASLIDW